MPRYLADSVFSIVIPCVTQWKGRLCIKVICFRRVLPVLSCPLSRLLTLHTLWTYPRCDVFECPVVALPGTFRQLHVTFYLWFHYLANSIFTGRVTRPYVVVFCSIMQAEHCWAVLTVGYKFNWQNVVALMWACQIMNFVLLSVVLMTNYFLAVFLHLLVFNLLKW